MKRRFPSFFLLLTILLLWGCAEERPLLDRVKERGELIVVTRNTPTTYYEGRQGPQGFEYDLVKRFADHLGVSVKMVVPERFTDILPMVMRGEADLAAAGLTVTEARRKQVRFSPSYQSIRQQLVYRAGRRKPRSVKDLIGSQLEVVAESSHVERLKELQREYPGLTWQEHADMDSEELLRLVAEELIDYTVADSNEVALARRYHPNLRVAFDLSESQPLAWAFRRGRDRSLVDEAARFLDDLKSSGVLAQLIERHYGHVRKVNPLDVSRFLLRIKSRLPRYRAWFEEAGRVTGLDWQLLAAMGYQESHWNAKAVSPTGVRGIMMLTRHTAREMGLTDRTDPRQSILGGARYFLKVKEKIPQRIAEPDRTWLALASYNIGFGHLEDARVLTQRAGKDPDRWMDVKEFLPLLSQRKWYSKTRKGYARGREAVTYVERIRRYYDALRWVMAQEAEPAPARSEALSIDPPVM